MSTKLYLFFEFCEVIMFIKIITIATLCCVVFLFYYNVLTIKEMLKYAFSQSKKRKVSILVVILACIATKSFSKELLFFMLNLFCIILLLKLLFM